MTRRIVRTTRRIQVNDPSEPVETIHEREVDRVIRDTDTTPGYGDDRTLQTVEYVQPETIVTRRDEIAEVNSWIRALQNTAARQLSLLREMDIRIGNLEQRDRMASSYTSFEKATWWALWGILMLILGAALVVVLLIIVTSLPH